MSGRFFGGSFHWKACGHLQEIFDWTDWELKNQISLVTFLYFYFRIIPLKIVNHEVFYLYRKSPWLDFVKVMLSVPEGIWLIKV